MPRVRGYERAGKGGCMMHWSGWALIALWFLPLILGGICAGFE